MSMSVVKQRISGSCDLRMIPVAAACWMGCLLGRWCWKVHMMHGVVTVFAGVVAVFIIAFLTWSILRVIINSNTQCTHTYVSMLRAALSSVRYQCFTWHRTISLVLHICAVACMLSYLTQCVLSQDVVMREIHKVNIAQVGYARRNSNQAYHIAEVTMVTPTRTSQSFNGDCQATVQVHYFAKQKSYVQARLYAYSPICEQLNYGSRIRLPVSVKASRFDSSKPELHVEKTQRNLHVVQGSDFWHRAVSDVWKSFYDVTNKLDMQGRMLVPGVTVGMLGQEYVPAEETNSLDPIDETYATMMRRHFQHAGIMHVMAVSGGHFLLLSMIIRRCCAYFLLPRWIMSFIQIVFQIVLAAIVYPSASVLRALVMGIISAVAWCCKRPYQSASALSWTVIGVLTCNPSYAWDYAFALSSAATLGIVMMGVPLSQTLTQYMPSCVASALAITFSAQCWTMPVQILMQPEVSFMAIPANIMVAPLMDWATVCGLISLVCAMFCAGVSLIFAQLASIATSLMEQCAYWCDEVSFGVFPWVRGALGAWVMACVEFTIFAVFMLAFRAFHNRYYIQRLRIVGQLWAASAKRTVSDTARIFEEE